ncbi:MAG: DNA-processing protein DprA, partial [Oscillospiraceae bacterium]
QKFGFLDARDQARFEKIALERAEMILKRCEELQISVVCFTDAAYPEKLRHIFGAPIVLYVKGDLSILEGRPAITVVGTRKASEYGKSVTGNLSYQLSKAGVVIISGCAVGIDTYAHMGALKAGGKTLSVLGCGINVDYPLPNRMLKQKILERGGALISELPPDSDVHGRYFPVRNRIMAGLADGILVTEAPLKSGALITAKQGNDLGRDVFCVPPYNIYDAKYTGVVPLIRDGAKTVFSVSDILEEYLYRYEGILDLKWVNRELIQVSGKSKEPLLAVADQNVYRASAEPPPPKEKQPVPEDCTDQQKSVYALLEYEPMHIDDLTRALNLPSYEVLSVLTELELLGCVTAYSGKRYGLA